MKTQYKMIKKKTNLITLLAGGLLVAGVGVAIIAADHIDSPNVASTTSDIADLYAFEGDNSDNTVFIATLQGPLMPGSQTNDAKFDEDVLVEFNIDNTGDFIEDLVIQAIRRGNQMYFFGPAAPAETGLSSTILTSANRNNVEISSGANAIVGNGDGMSFYAGPRRDPFFFDFNQFNQVVSGAAAPNGFLPAGEASDFFADLNVLAIAVEVPNSMLGEAPAHVAGAVGINGLPNAYNVWVSTKRR